MKILCGTTVKVEKHVFEAYWGMLQLLKKPKGVPLDFIFVDDNDDYHIRDIADARVFDPVEKGPGYDTTGSTHSWNTNLFDRVGLAKQRILDYALEFDYTHVFLVDSDLLLETTTLMSMLSVDQPIVYGVFWTRWENNPAHLPLPQTWLKHPYGLEGLGMTQERYLRSLCEAREVVEVLGGGACTLVRSEALRKGLRYHPRMQGLEAGPMSEGEDRTWAKIAEGMHILQFADGWPNIYHAYHPHQRTPEALKEARRMLAAPRQTKAKMGDLINFTINPLEHPEFIELLRPEAKCFRGRFGGIHMLPELEVALSSMVPGESRIETLVFPGWWPFDQFQGKSLVVEVTMVDIKPMGYPPVIHEVAYRGTT